MWQVTFASQCGQALEVADSGAFAEFASGCRNCFRRNLATLVLCHLEVPNLTLDDKGWSCRSTVGGSCGRRLRGSLGGEWRAARP